MEYHLEEVVWEMSRKCNLCCGHCGSDCTSAEEEGELLHGEMIRLAEELIKAGIKCITLSGGEPLLHPLWKQMAELFNRAGVEVRMVTNGTLISKEMAAALKQAGLRTVSVSIDGLEEQHNEMRRAICYQTCVAALDNLKEVGIAPAVNTTITRKNLPDIKELFEVFKTHGVSSWQIQIALPSGRMADQKELILNTGEIMELIDFAYCKNKEASVPAVFLAETIGYYTWKEGIARQAALRSEKLPVWRGCPAGISSMGILSNGDIVGCTSLQEAVFREENIKNIWKNEESLLDFWNRQDAFSWRRTLTVDKFSGNCRDCRYGIYCLGGCTNARYSMKQTIYAGNELCVYGQN